MALLMPAGVVFVRSTLMVRGSDFKKEIYPEVARWLNEHARPGDSLGTMEIGQLRYYYEHGPVIDGLGLANPAIAASVERQEYDWFIHEYKPTWILFRIPPGAILEEAAHTEWFRRQYRAVAAFGGRFRLYRRNKSEQP
jgi:hypothetical protein